MIFYLLTLILAYIIYVIFYKWTMGICKCQIQMSDKVVIITGANTGIGYETALDLAKRNAKVILACRSIDKGIVARDSIIAATGNKNVIFKQLDLTSFKSVRVFCDGIILTEPKIDVLINNAGMGNLDNSLTEDNLPIEVQVNYLSPYLLTLLLLPLLKASAPSRIINVSSALHWLGAVDLQTFHKQARSNLSKRRQYCNTKLANILFTVKLAEVLKDTNVTANALHPGAVYTEILREKHGFFRLMAKVFFKNRWEGAQTTIHLAVSPDLANVSGKYFSDCVESFTSKAAKDPKLANDLWELSNSLVFAK